MKQVFFASVLIALTSTPLVAEDDNRMKDNSENMDRGFSLVEEGTRLIFRGIMKEMEPAMDDFRDMAQELTPQLQRMVDEFGPALRDLATQIEDFSLYAPPEMLPNGDIIIRKRTPEQREKDRDALEGMDGDSIDL